MQVRFCVYVPEAMLPRHKKPKRILAILSTEIEPGRGISTDYPVVARTAYGDREQQEFRYRDGIFYKRLEVEDGSRTEVAFINHFWPRTFRAQALAAGSVRPKEVLPKDVIYRITAHGSVVHEIAPMTKMGREMVLSDEAAADVERVRREFVSMANETVVIDGEFWVPTPEPMLSADCMHGLAITLLETHFTNVRMPEIINKHSLGRFAFTFRQIDEAEGYSRVSDRNPLKVEIFVRSVFSENVPVGFSLSLLRYLSEEKKFPRPLRKRLKAYVDRDAPHDWDDVVAEIGFLLSRPGVEGHYRRSLEIEMDRIEARPIGLTAIAATKVPTRPE